MEVTKAVVLFVDYDQAVGSDGRFRSRRAVGFSSSKPRFELIKASADNVCGTGWRLWDDSA